MINVKGCLKFPDDVSLVLTSPDEYGTEHHVDQAIVPAIVELNTGYSHSNWEDNVESDARVFLDPRNDWVREHCFRLEEQLMHIHIFGCQPEDNWYKITNVEVFKDHQLCNNVDHIEVLLKKTVDTPGDAVCGLGETS